MRLTVREVAELLDVDPARADGLLKYLSARRLARFRGEAPPVGGRGRGPKVYEVLDGAAEAVAADIKKLEG